MSESDERGIELFDDPLHPLVIRRWPSVSTRHLRNLSMDKGNGRGRLAKGQTFNQLFKFGL